MSHHSYTPMENETIPGLTTISKDNYLVEYEDSEAEGDS